MTLFDFEITDIHGKTFDWNTVKGKKILIVNTASECGYTFHYGPLEDLYLDYRDKGFTVIGFPCNDFGGQEPGTEEEIAQFCSRNFDVTFPMMSKIKILGSEAHPLYQWLKKETNSEVAWNFQKYLVDENGQVVKMISHNVDPQDPEIVQWITN